MTTSGIWENGRWVPGPGSKDGDGASDNDQPYRWGRRITAHASFPFTEKQYVRLLIQRSYHGALLPLECRPMLDRITTSTTIADILSTTDKAA